MSTEQDKVKGRCGCGCCLKSCFLCSCSALAALPLLQPLPLLPALPPHTQCAIKTANKTNAKERNTRQQAAEAALPAQTAGNSPSPCPAQALHHPPHPRTSFSVLGQPSERVNSQQLSSQKRKRYVRTFFMQESAASIGLARARAQALLLAWPGLALAFG